MTTTINDAVQLKDIYQNAMNAVNFIRGETGIIFDRRMSEHLCLWDQNYPECPERFTRVLERCEELGLIERCKFIQPRMATECEVLTKHTQEQIDTLKATKGANDEAALEELSSNYDAIYIHPVSRVFGLNV